MSHSLGRTTLTTYWRAQRLGLGLGCPADAEYMTAAAHRCGYATIQLRRILRLSGVQIHASIARFRRGRSFHWVIPEEVDAAVARWHRTETPNAAARARGVSLSRLVARLLACGLPLPKRPGHKRHWRIPSATIDRALAMVVRRGNHLEVRKEAA